MAFDKVWHKGLIVKLSQNGISGNLLEILSDFLSDRKQRVLPNGQKSIWEDVNDHVWDHPLRQSYLLMINFF